MKRNILVVFLLLLNLALCGQKTITLQAGVSLSKLNWYNSMSDGLGYEETLTGFNAALGIEYPDREYFFFSTKLGFIQKGGKDHVKVINNSENETGTMKVITRLNYIILNTTANFKYPFKGVIIPYIFIGPQLGYLISYWENVSSIQQFDNYGLVEKIRFGMIAGGGIKTKINKWEFGTVLTYDYGFFKLVDSTLGWGDNKMTDNAFTLNLQIGYNL